MRPIGDRARVVDVYGLFFGADSCTCSSNRLTAPMFATYLPVFVLAAIAIIVAAALFTLTTLAGPKNPTPEKLLPYESGFRDRGRAACPIEREVLFDRDSICDFRYRSGVSLPLGGALS